MTRTMPAMLLSAWSSGCARLVDEPGMSCAKEHTRLDHAETSSLGFSAQEAIEEWNTRSTAIEIHWSSGQGPDNGLQTSMLQATLSALSGYAPEEVSLSADPGSHDDFCTGKILSVPIQLDLSDDSAQLTLAPLQGTLWLRDLSFDAVYLDGAADVVLADSLLAGSAEGPFQLEFSFEELQPGSHDRVALRASGVGKSWSDGTWRLVRP